MGKLQFVCSILIGERLVDSIEKGGAIFLSFNHVAR